MDPNCNTNDNICVTIDGRICLGFWFLMFANLFLEKTNLSIEGQVPTDSVKFEFTGFAPTAFASTPAKTVFTYVQTTDAGISVEHCQIIYATIFYRNNIFYEVPQCGEGESCTDPAFVKATKGKISASTVKFPTVFKVCCVLYHFA